MFSFSILGALLLLLHGKHISADHHVCTWGGPGPLSPSSYGFAHFGEAGVDKINDTHASYTTPFPGNALVKVQVADYGFLAPRTLEFATACGGKGYAGNGLINYCITYKVWAVCLGKAGSGVDPKAVNCRYLAAKDDCSWPDQFDADKIPQSVDIWGRTYF